MDTKCLPSSSKIFMFQICKPSYWAASTGSYLQSQLDSGSTVKSISRTNTYLLYWSVSTITFWPLLIMFSTYNRNATKEWQTFLKGGDFCLYSFLVQRWWLTYRNWQYWISYGEGGWCKSHHHCTKSLAGNYQLLYIPEYSSQWSFHVGLYYKNRTVSDLYVHQ